MTEQKSERIFDETIFRDHLKSKITAILTDIDGPKDIYLNSHIIGPLNMF